MTIEEKVVEIAINKINNLKSNTEFYLSDLLIDENWNSFTFEGKGKIGKLFYNTLKSKKLLGKLVVHLGSFENLEKYRKI